ncbi:Hypothetical predicted protein [Pelobates cultripes]|uniref:Uncharacterized protein n=1 Tax=Pelobates cultripes TaxID=61616 RepID=A0AAD1TLH1_PELCU|nr:Hypothetical predicted protein [Pelobates cultripes]
MPHHRQEGLRDHTLDDRRLTTLTPLPTPTLTFPPPPEERQGTITPIRIDTHANKRTHRDLNVKLTRTQVIIPTGKLDERPASLCIAHTQTTIAVNVMYNI